MTLNNLEEKFFVNLALKFSFPVSPELIFIRQFEISKFSNFWELQRI